MIVEEILVFHRAILCANGNVMILPARLFATLCVLVLNVRWNARRLLALNAQFTAKDLCARFVALRIYVKKLAALNVKQSANLLAATRLVLLLNPTVLQSVKNLTAKTNASSQSTVPSPSVNCNVNDLLVKLMMTTTNAAHVESLPLLNSLSTKPQMPALVLLPIPLLVVALVSIHLWSRSYTQCSIKNKLEPRNNAAHVPVNTKSCSALSYIKWWLFFVKHLLFNTTIVF
jgi:hypothetical protein